MSPLFQSDSSPKDLVLVIPTGPGFVVDNMSGFSRDEDELALRTWQEILAPLHNTANAAPTAISLACNGLIRRAPRVINRSNEFDYFAGV